MQKYLVIDNVSSSSVIKVEFNLTKLIEDVVNSIREEVDEIIATIKFEKIIFDFKNISEIDIHGLTMIIGRFNNISKKNGKLYIVNSNDNIKKRLKIINLDRIIDIN